jgi:hypothetical protein
MMDIRIKKNLKCRYLYIFCGSLILFYISSCVCLFLKKNIKNNKISQLLIYISCSFTELLGIDKEFLLWLRMHKGWLVGQGLHEQSSFFDGHGYLLQGKFIIPQRQIKMTWEVKGTEANITWNWWSLSVAITHSTRARIWYRFQACCTWTEMKAKDW